jgi:hypothetical protein
MNPGGTSAVEATMPRWTKWVVIGALIAIPTLGFGVTKYRSHHRSCPVKGDCPYATTKKK